MTRKATDVVTTIGIDIGKNRLHLIGLEGCFGSKFPLPAMPNGRPESGVKQSKSAGESAFGGRLAVAVAWPAREKLANSGPSGQNLQAL
jgi:hypothetical protein